MADINRPQKTGPLNFIHLFLSGLSQRTPEKGICKRSKWSHDAQCTDRVLTGEHIPRFSPFFIFSTPCFFILFWLVLRSHENGGPSAFVSKLLDTCFKFNFSTIPLAPLAPPFYMIHVLNLTSQSGGTWLWYKTNIQSNGSYCSNLKTSWTNHRLLHYYNGRSSNL